MTFDWLEDVPFWPERISQHAAQVDTILVGFAAVLVLLAAPVFVAIVWFAIKYRRGSPASRRGRPYGSPWLEIGWAAIPLAILVFFFVQAARSYFTLHRDVSGALQVDVVAKQWMWKFQHATGKRQINQLNVPVDTPIELTMISQDVIHSLYLPALRIKQDVLPHRYTKLRFHPDRTGTFHLTCAEFCGTQHARMGGEIRVMDKQAYAEWAARAAAFAPPEAAGQRLFREKGCAACHDGERAPAPELAGLFGSLVALVDGTRVRADETYLRTAMVLPNRHVVAGFEPIMPSYQESLAEEEIRNLIAYIKSLPPRSGGGG